MRSTSVESTFSAGEEEAGEWNAADDLWPVREWAAAAAAAFTPARRGGACIRLLGGDGVCGAVLEGVGEPGEEGWVRAAEERWRELHQSPYDGTVGAAGDPPSDPASPKQGSALPAPSGAAGVTFAQHLGSIGLLCGLVPAGAPRGGGGTGVGDGDEVMTGLLIAWVDPVVSRTALLARALALPEQPLAPELPSVNASGGELGFGGDLMGARGDEGGYVAGEGDRVEEAGGGAAKAESVGVLGVVEWRTEVSALLTRHAGAGAAGEVPTLHPEP